MPERKFEDGEIVGHKGFRMTIISAYYEISEGWYYDIGIDALDIHYQRVAEADLSQLSPEFYYPHSH